MNAIEHFLQSHGWADAQRHDFPADWGNRRYARLIQPEGRTALLMDMTIDGGLADYMKIAEYWRGCGLATPEIYAVDDAKNLAVIEDFGDESFGDRLRADPAGRAELYTLATQVLIHLRDAVQENASAWPDYEDTVYYIGKRRVLDWFVPAVLKRSNDAVHDQSFLAAWGEIEAQLPPCRKTLCHADYHPENLMWREGKDGLARCGVIDFQDGFYGPRPYDLVNLLEDIRNDIPEDIRAGMIALYCADLSAEDKAAFMAWYRVMAMHFHCRIAGQCLKLAIKGGRDDLLVYLPRVMKYIESGLQDPLLRPLKDWFAGQGIEFTAMPAIDPETAQRYIRDDAY